MKKFNAERFVAARFVDSFRRELIYFGTRVN